MNALMGQHGGFGQAGGAAGELEVANEVREDLGLGVV